MGLEDRHDFLIRELLPRSVNRCLDFVWVVGVVVDQLVVSNIGLTEPPLNPGEVGEFLLDLVHVDFFHVSHRQNCQTV